MWSQDGQPLGVLPSSAGRGDNKLPPLPGSEFEGSLDLPDVPFSEVKRVPKVRRTAAGGNDLASLSRKRRDAALAGRADVLDVGITLPAPRALPGTLLKSSPAAVRTRASPPAASPVEPPAFAVPGSLTASAGHEHHVESKTELQKLQEELRLRNADLDRCKSALKKKSEEYEGCFALLNVTQAELRLCQERIRTQSPTPPAVAPRRLKGINVFASERELAEEAAAWAVSTLLSRVQLRLNAAKANAKDESEMEKQRLRKQHAKKSRESPVPPGHNRLSSPVLLPDDDLDSTLDSAGNAGKSAPRKARDPGGSEDADDAAQEEEAARGPGRRGPPHPGTLDSAGNAGKSAPRKARDPGGSEDADDAGQEEEAARGPGRRGPPHTGSLDPEVAQGERAHTGMMEADDSPSRPSKPPRVDAATGKPSRKAAGPTAGPAGAEPEGSEPAFRDPQRASPRVAAAPAKTAGARPAKSEKPEQGADGHSVATHKRLPEGEDDLAEMINAQDQELDAEALQTASKGEAQAYTPAQSPPPDTGGTPTPGVYGAEEEEAPEWQNCSVIREQEVVCAATQTTPSPDSNREVAPDAKASVTAQEEIRALKLVVANSKKEITYYNKVLLEKNAEHQQELQELQDAVVQERKRCEEDMKCWKKHVKKELSQDPIMTVALWMWDREMTAIRTRQAFDNWKRKSNQMVKARGMSGKIAMLATLHQVLRDWRVNLVEFKAERMKIDLQKRWFHSLDKATISWGRELDHGLKTSAMAAWAWQTKYTLWEARAQMRVRQTLQRWFYSSREAVLHFALRSWMEAMNDVRLQAFRLHLQGKQAAFTKAILAFAPSVDGLDLRAIFYAWTWATQNGKVSGLSRRLQRSDTKVEKALIFMAEENSAVFLLCIFRRWVSQVEGLKAKILVAKLKALGAPTQIINAMTHFAQDQPVLMLQNVLLGWHRHVYLQTLRNNEDPSKKQAIAFCITAFTAASRGMAFGGWKRIVQKRNFQRSWLRFFRPAEDLLPLLRAWRVQVIRSEACQRVEVRVEKKENDNMWFVVFLIFVMWRMKLRPSAAVLAYVPKIARCQEVALRKLGDLQVSCCFLVIFRVWAKLIHEGKAEIVIEKSKEAEKQLEEKTAQVEALQKGLKETEEKKAEAEANHAKEKSEMQQELEKAKKSKCCVVM